MSKKVDLGSYFEEFIEGRVNSGRYSTASEVVRDGLRLLESRDNREEEFVNTLREKILKSRQSGSVEFSADRIREIGRKKLATNQKKIL